MVLVILAVVYITILNRKHAATRTQMGKAANVLDLSMETSEQMKEADEMATPEAGGVGDKAFDDETDLRNEDFIYLY